VPNSVGGLLPWRSWHPGQARSKPNWYRSQWQGWQWQTRQLGPQLPQVPRIPRPVTKPTPGEGGPKRYVEEVYKEFPTIPGGPDGDSVPGGRGMPWGENGNGNFDGNGGFTFSVALRCNQPGCEASNGLLIDPKVAVNRGSCTLNLTLFNTDYDSGENAPNEASPEQLEFVQIPGVMQRIEKVRPGKNPCVSALQGNAVPTEDLEHTILQDQDLTSFIRKQNQDGQLVNGFVKVQLQAKISSTVDECAHNGFLLDAIAKVRCSAGSYRGT